MKDLTSAMQTALAPRASAASVSRNRTRLFEVYESDYFPNEDGVFDPADALARWAKTSLTWLGNEYERRVLSHQTISQYMSGQFDGTSLTIENADRYLSQFVTTNDIDGMRLVIRYINIDFSATLADSVVEFVGRLKSPDGSDIDREQGEIAAEEELASLDIQVPKKRISPEDPNDRSPADPLYEGFTFNARPSTVKYVETSTSRKFLIFLKRKDTLKYNQWSSETGAADQIIPLGCGRVQLEGLPAFFVDIGFYIVGIWVFAGQKVASIDNFQLPDSNYIFYGIWADHALQQAHVHLGDPGGTGTNATPDTIEGNYPQNTALLSRTAYVGFAIGGPETETQPFANPQMDAVPTLVGIVRFEMDLPDGDGVFNQKGNSDSPVYFARFVLTSPDYFGLDPRLIYDGELPTVHAERQRPIIDKSNGELLFLPGYDAKALADGKITRFNSSGLLSTAYFKNAFDSGNPDPLTTSRTDSVPILLDPGGCPDGFVWNPITETCDAVEPLLPVVPAVSMLRRAYTLNLPLTDAVNASDFLNDVVLATGRLYKLYDSAGRVRIRAKKASDSAYLVADASIGDTSILIANVEPWRASDRGYVLIDVGLVTSETRRITAAQYDPTTGNAMPLAVSSPGTSLSVSGATLSGGSTSVPSSGVVTVDSAGTPGDLLTVTVWDIPISYTVSSADDVNSIAGILCASINADPNLRQYVRAVWNAATITIYSTVGHLSFADALVHSHVAQVDSPVDGPTATAVTSGSLDPGDYYLGYTLVDGSGEETVMSPLTKITITSGHKVSVSSLGALPAGAAEVNWYFSPAPNDDHVQFLETNSGGSFTINSLPDLDADFPPGINQTGAETIRVMEVFNERNIRTGSFKWSPSKSKINQLTGTYVDAAQGFKSTPITVNDRAHQRKIRQTNKKEINLRGVDNFSQASRLLYAALAEERDGGTRFKWDTDDAGIPLEIGDVVAVSGNYVDATGSVQKEFVNQPVIIEQTDSHEDFDVSFDSRIYSSSLLEGQTGRRPVVLSTTLKKFTEPPPVASNVALTEFAGFDPDMSVISGIRGTFDFGQFSGSQIARIFLAGPSDSAPADADYKEIDAISPDANFSGAFEIRGVAIGKQWVKVKTVSIFGKSAASGHPVTSIVISQPPAEPLNFAGQRIGSDVITTWDPGVPGAFLPETYVLRVRDSSSGALKRTVTIQIPDWIPCNWTLYYDAGDETLVSLDPDGSIYSTVQPTGVLIYISQPFFGDLDIAWDVDDRPFQLLGVLSSPPGTVTGVFVENAGWYGQPQFIDAEVATGLIKRLPPNSHLEIRIRNNQAEYWLNGQFWMRSFQGPLPSTLVVSADMSAATVGPQAMLRVRVKPFVPRQFIYTTGMAETDFGTDPGVERFDLTQISQAGVESPVASIVV